MNSKELKSYLLGTLATGREEMEERLFLDEAFFELVEAEEEELIQNYVDGELSAADVERFEDHFLISDERVKHLKFAESLRNRIDEATDAQQVFSADINKKDSGLVSWLFPNLRSFSPIPITAGIVVLFLVGYIGYWSMTGPEKLTAQETEYASMNSTPLTDFESRTDLTIVELFPGRPRSELDGLGNLRSDSKQNILFRLALPENVGDRADFQIELFLNDQRVFFQPKIAVFRNSGGEELRFLFPAGVFRKGDYVLEATGQDGRIYSYPLSVE